MLWIFLPLLRLFIVINYEFSINGLQPINLLIPYGFSRTFFLFFAAFLLQNHVKEVEQYKKYRQRTLERKSKFWRSMKDGWIIRPKNLPALNDSSLFWLHQSGQSIEFQPRWNGDKKPYNKARPIVFQPPLCWILWKELLNRTLTITKLALCFQGPIVHIYRTSKPIRLILYFFQRCMFDLNSHQKWFCSVSSIILWNGCCLICHIKAVV